MSPAAEQLPDFLGSPAVLAASWRIGAELVSSVPGVHLRELHPGGGMYDVLAVVADEPHGFTQLVHVNRVGSIHVMAGRQEGPLPGGPSVWWDCLAPGGTKRVVQQVISRLEPRVGSRPSRSWVLTYRVIAAALSQRVFDTEAWDCRAVNNGVDDYGPTEWHQPEPDLRGVAPSSVWVLRAGDAQVAQLHRGWAWTVEGSRHNLVDMYARGASPAEIAAVISRRPKAPRTAPGADLPVPREQAPLSDVIQFAQSYNAYRRVAAEPGRLEQLLEPAMRLWLSDGGRVDVLGLDTLRALLFLEHRADYFAGGTPDGERRMRALVRAIRAASNGAVPDNRAADDLAPDPA